MNRSFEGFIKGIEQFDYANLVNSGTVLQSFQIGNLAFVAVELELLENREGFWVFPDDIGDNHVLRDHGALLVVTLSQSRPYLPRRAFLTSGGTKPSMLPFREQTSLTMEEERYPYCRDVIIKSVSTFWLIQLFIWAI